MREDAEKFLTLILEGDRRRTERCAREILVHRGVAFLYEQIVQPALDEVGARWHANRLHIADEHLATATAEAAIAALYPQFPWPARGPRAVVACAQGERHELGARMVADLLALDGWDERFVGADVPVDELVRKVSELAPRLLALSVTLPLHTAMARAAIERIRAADPRVKILVGGRAIAAPRAVADAIGADAIARTATEAVEVAREWK